MHDPAEVAARVVSMIKEGRVQANNGQWVELRADTICVHGDTPEALQHLQALRQALAEAGIEVVGL